tara:strand:- start:228 stop:521 length:294 start_codon:yes stop_codon:yes gene_type:complete
MNMSEVQNQGQQQGQEQQEPVNISLQDIATVVQLIDIVSRRGGIEGNEMAGVGMLRNKLETFLRQNTPEEQGGEGDGTVSANGSIPVDAPLAGKVKS